MQLLLTLLFMVYTVSNAQILEVSQLFNKKLVKVQKEQIGTLKSFYGHTAINESKIYDIVTRFDGFITKINADKQFMPIKKGQALFSIYSDEILSIQKELHIAKKINQKLYQSSLDKLEAFDIHPTQLRKIKKQKALKSIDVISSYNAIVLQKNINQGSYAKKGKLLLQLANLDSLWFIAQVYQKDLESIEIGQKAKILVDGQKTPYTSTVDFIYPIINKKTKTVDVRFILENKEKNLLPNMFATITLLQNKKSRLTLPKTAVLNKGSKYYVFQPISKEEFEPIEVSVKRISSNKYEILDGVEEGQTVINNALFLLDSDAVTNALYEEDDDDW